MISKDDIEKMMDDESVLFDQDVQEWFDKAGMEPSAFAYLCTRLADILREGIASKSMETLDDEEARMRIVEYSIRAGMGMAFMVGWEANDHFTGNGSVVKEWPAGDVVARGVLTTVADRRDLASTEVFREAREFGEQRFYETLDDKDGFVDSYFVTLAGPGIEDVGIDYDRHVGPAVDRIEDWLYPES